MTFRHTQDMGEMSGFGGEYEETCQKMLEAGVLWLNDHPDCLLVIGSVPGVIGIVNPESDDAKELTDTIVNASRDKEGKSNCTGAMVHELLGRLFYIRHNGWDKYCVEVRKYNLENPDPEAA